MYENINELAIEVKMKNMNTNNNQFPPVEGVHNMVVDQSGEKTTNRFSPDVTELRLRFENLSKDYEIFKKSCKSQLQQSLEMNSSVPEKKEKAKAENSNSSKSEENVSISEKIKGFEQEMLSLREKSSLAFIELEKKIAKEDFEKAQKAQTNELDKFYTRISEMMNRVEKKLNGVNFGENEKFDTGFNLVELVHYLLINL